MIVISICSYHLYFFLKVEMKNVKDAKFIESLISQNDLKAFVCSNRDDLKLFLDEVTLYFKHMHLYLSLY